MKTTCQIVIKEITSVNFLETTMQKLQLSVATISRYSVGGRITARKHKTYIKSARDKVKQGFEEGGGATENNILRK
jgi:hypothetical protein